jgi:hypothetical protein
LKKLSKKRKKKKEKKKNKNLHHAQAPHHLEENITTLNAIKGGI